MRRRTRNIDGEPTRLEIGDRNVFREFVTLNRGTDEGRRRDAHRQRQPVHGVSRTSRTTASVGDHCVLANYATLGGHVQLGDWVIMGGFSGIHQFCKVGAHAFIANNAAVTRDVPPYVMAVGQPAVPHSINSEGLKRRGFTPEQIRNLRNAFRLLYRSGLKLADARARAQGAGGRSSPSLAALVEFLPQSTRSIVR